MKLNEQIKRITEMMGVISEDIHKSQVLFKTALDKKNFESFQKMVELQFIVDGEEKGKMKCGDIRKFTESGQEITTKLKCTTAMMEMSVDAGTAVWNFGGSTKVKTKLTDASAKSMSSAGVKINGGDPANFSIEMTLDQLSSDPTKTIDVTIGAATTTNTSDSKKGTNEFPSCLSDKMFIDKKTRKGSSVKSFAEIFYFYDNGRVYFLKSDAKDDTTKNRKPVGNYSCLGDNTIEMSTTQYDSVWDYKVTVNIVSDRGLQVTKIETKRKTKTSWITVTKKEQKDAIKLKVFGILG
jgi:hypothetical protein